MTRLPVDVATPPPIEAGSNHHAVIAPKPNFAPAHYSAVGQVLKTGTLGTAYNETITTQGGVSPYTYALTAGALPTSLSLNSSTSVISGTPTALGTFSFTIQSTDSGGYVGSTAFQIIIAAPPRGGGPYTFIR